MSSFVKISSAAALLLFVAYVIQVEPNASADPFGATQRAATRLATTCDRNPQECAFVADTVQRIGQFGNIGWGLATGQGRLVYVSTATTNGPAGPPSSNAASGSEFQPTHNGSGQALSISSLLGGGNGATNGQVASPGSGISNDNSSYANSRSDNSPYDNFATHCR